MNNIKIDTPAGYRNRTILELLYATGMRVSELSGLNFENLNIEENEEYFGDVETKYKYEYLATLDARTCLVCGDLDGRLYEKIEDAPSLPQHRGCRYNKELNRT